ncbi:MAG: sulfotransferase [Mesorhizobium sp.]|nr:sulfotransferase [Mesorhizobium sp.]
MRSEFQEKQAGDGPIAVGGIGGGGTRIFADFLRRCGVYIGSDLNTPLDNLWFTLLFKRRSVLAEDQRDLATLYAGFAEKMATGRFPPGLKRKVERLAMRSEHEHPPEWFAERSRTLFETHEPAVARWGWKEPNTHILAERLLELDRRLRYVHVVRHPLDIASSSNNNQLRLWGEVFLDDASGSHFARKLDYWCKVQTTAEAVRDRFPERCIIVRYEDMVTHTEASATFLSSVLGVRLSPEALADYRGTLTPPDFASRWDQEEVSRMSAADIRFASARGYVLA